MGGMASTTLSAPSRREFVGTLAVDLGHEMAQRQLERIRVAAGAARLVTHYPYQFDQLRTADTERLKAVAQPASPAGRRAAVPADVDGHAHWVGLG